MRTLLPGLQRLIIQIHIAVRGLPYADGSFSSPNGMGHCIVAFTPCRLYIDHAEASLSAAFVPVRHEFPDYREALLHLEGKVNL